jgi:MurNAc alpha-1-phosphate uridylyltransferase
MVLAAGFGTRMRPLTDRLPKPLLAVAGRTLLDRALDRVAEAGLARAVVNVHYRADMIRAHLAGRRTPEIAISEEAPAILDTGGGIRRALPLLGARPFAVVNADALWTGPCPVAALRAAWEPARMDALLLLVPRGRARAHAGAGDFFLDAPGGAPARRGGAARAPFVYTGAQILAPGAMEGTPEGAFSLNRVWDGLLARGRLAAIVHGGGWVDVGTPAGLEAAEAALAEAEG